MQINIFEAGRRLLRIVQGIGLLALACELFIDRPLNWFVLVVVGVYLVGITLSAMALGWILRGLLGIPTGEDRRPQPLPPPYC